MWIKVDYNQNIFISLEFLTFTIFYPQKIRFKHFWMRKIFKSPAGFELMTWIRSERANALRYAGR